METGVQPSGRRVDGEPGRDIVEEFDAVHYRRTFANAGKHPVTSFLRSGVENWTASA
jgi:hypothetical protein